MELLAVAKPGYTSLSPDRDTVASFDREGRLYAYFKAGVTYRRSLASGVEARWKPGPDGAPAGPGQRQRRRLSPAEARELFREVYAMAAACLPYARGPVRERLEEEILRWTPESLLAEAERFAQVYKPISILPPDHYLSIVLQATEGCTWNRCTFCSFYQDRPFRAKSTQEFAEHVAAVRRFLGRGVRMRKGVFLADGNALALSYARLEPMFQLAREAFPNQRIYSFVDLYTGERRPVAEWRRLAELGLHRVYIGMETGLDELLQFLNKPGSQDELVAFVADLKQAGLDVGLIVMVGVGGAQYREAHAQATLAAIARLPLGAGDLVYLSPFIEYPGSVYSFRRQAAGLTPLSPEETEVELRRLAEKLRAGGVRAARYDIREFIY
ncbi:MAG TPA: radical SAM protein [Limnochordales bacterium]